MKRSTISIILLVLLLGLLIDPVSAANYGGVPQSDLRTEPQTFVTSFTDQSMKGLFSTAEQTFWIAKDWDVETVLLHLEYRATQLADTQLSSLTVAINGTYFYSLRPADNTGNRHGIDIYVPLESLKQGYNNIRIDGYMRTQNTLPCVDDVSEANWLDLFKESTVSVRFDKNAFTTSIESFYNRFFEVDALRYGESAFIISDSNSPAELNAALLGISGMSNQTIYTDGYFPILTLSDPAANLYRNRIIIAWYDQLPENYRNLADHNGINDEDAVLVLLNEGAGINTLIITAKNEAALINAGRMLGNQSLMNQLQAPEKLLGKTEDIKTEVYEAETYICFAGLEGSYYTGPFHQVKEFTINYPANRSLTNASEFYLNYRYSENLDFDRSLMTVYINDVPVGSRKLSQSKAGGDEATIPIPIDIDIGGSFQVKVTFDLEIKDLWCSLRQGDMPWAYLTPNTMLKINSVTSQDLIFENYPSPFVTDYSYNAVSLVVPDQLDGETANLLGKMFRVMGRYTRGNTGELTVLFPEEMNEAALYSNIIAVGTYENNSFIKNNNDKLFFQFNEDGTTFLSNEKLVIDPTYGKTLGSAQLLTSVYNKPGRASLMVTAPNQTGLVAIGNNLGEIKNLGRLSGDAALADTNGNVQSYRFKAPKNPTIAVVQQISVNQEAQIFLLVSIMVIILLAVGLIMVVRKNGIELKKGGWRK
ncbi:cellulose biosynthesis cyclic di-GMP-binding regulatory protein BcsB [Acetobacterium wieringae]|uniref:cellulose biosynthesis cyclic di-GMP-binding regulatory protein BcsB n=1 Tax=Acetobacterium wieringae TaxID=52694 RepID=UPI0026E97F39|nr:cellulose biosynthesis cyclic di-GMP-binding regulatory protein BcsB [Acetobacterium wieringae]